MLDGDNDAAIGLAEQAAAIAEPLGVTDVVSDALNTQACALGALGPEASVFISVRTVDHHVCRAGQT
jgi:hypothetical protein